MFFCLLILMLLCLYKFRIAKHQQDYMGMDQTTSIKGIFVVIVLLSHMKQYLSPSLFMDSFAFKSIGMLGQLMVTVFFFYSGYGILASAAKKENYGTTFFKNRILKTWIYFVIAVVCYLVLSIAVGKTYSTWDYILCWTGWTSLGNSNWFIFVMLALYVVTWLPLLAVRRLPAGIRLWVLTFVVSVLSVGLWVIIRASGKAIYWYDTLLCYAAGMWFYLCKPLFDKIISKWYLRAGMWILFLVAFLVLYKSESTMAYSLSTCVFCLIVTLLTTNVRIDNKVLRWLGKNTFTIYIFQRIPMIVLQTVGLDKYNAVFIPVAVVVTMLLAELFSRIYKCVDSILDKR